MTLQEEILNSNNPAFLGKRLAYSALEGLITNGKMTSVDEVLEFIELDRASMKQVEDKGGAGN